MQTDEQLLKAWQDFKEPSLLMEKKGYKFMANTNCLTNFDPILRALEEGKKLLGETVLIARGLDDCYVKALELNSHLKQEIQERKSSFQKYSAELYKDLAGIFFLKYYYNYSEDRTKELHKANLCSNQARIIIREEKLDQDGNNKLFMECSRLEVFSSFEETLCQVTEFLESDRTRQSLAAHHEYLINILATQKQDQLFFAYLLAQANYYIEQSTQSNSEDFIEKIKEIFPYIIKARLNCEDKKVFTPLNFTIERMLVKLRRAISLLSDDKKWKSWLEGALWITLYFKKHLQGFSDIDKQVRVIENAANKQLSRLQEQEKSASLEEYDSKFSEILSQFEKKPSKKIVKSTSSKPQKTKKAKNRNSPPPKPIKRSESPILVSDEEQEEIPQLYVVTAAEINKPTLHKKVSFIDLKELTSSLKNARSELDYFAEAKLNFSQAELYHHEAFENKSSLSKKIKFLELAHHSLSEAIDCFDKAIFSSPISALKKLHELREWAIFILDDLKKDMGKLLQTSHARYQNLEQEREEAKKRLGLAWFKNLSLGSVSQRAKEFMKSKANLAKIHQLHTNTENLQLPPLTLGEFIPNLESLPKPPLIMQARPSKILPPDVNSQGNKSLIGLIAPLPEQPSKLNFDFIKSRQEMRTLFRDSFFPDKRRLSVDTAERYEEDYSKKFACKWGGRF